MIKLVNAMDAATAYIISKVILNVHEMFLFRQS